MLAIIQQTGSDLVGLTPQDNVSILKLTAGGIDELKYMIYPASEAFNTATERLTEVTAIDKQFDEEVFRGRVKSISGKASDSTTQTITCEGAVARLKDGCFNGRVTPGEIIMYTFQRILNMHNELVDDEAKVYLGSCPMTGITVAKSFDYVPTIDVINEIASDLGLEWRIRYDDTTDKYKLDIAEFFGGVAAEPIVVGSNLGLIRYTTDPSAVATRIIPLGGIGYDGKRLTVQSYHGQGRIYIDNTELIAKYGVIVKTVIHDDIAVDDPRYYAERVNTLYAAGVADAETLANKAVTWEITAVDLSRAGYNVDTFKVGWYYHIMHPILGADVILRLVEITIDYRNPQRTKLVFGDKAATLTNSLVSSSQTAQAQRTAQIINMTQIIDNRMDGTIIQIMTQSQYDEMATHSENILYVVLPDGDTRSAKETRGEVQMSEQVDVGGVK